MGLSRRLPVWPRTQDAANQFENWPTGSYQDSRLASTLSSADYSLAAKGMAVGVLHEGQVALWKLLLNGFVLATVVLLSMLSVVVW